MLISLASSDAFEFVRRVMNVRSVCGGEEGSHQGDATDAEHVGIPDASMASAQCHCSGPSSRATRPSICRPNGEQFLTKGPAMSA
jgi:hypothetical protein